MASVLGHLCQSEKLSEIKPPLKADITSLYFTKLLNHMKKENIVKVVPKGSLILEFILISVRPSLRLTKQLFTNLPIFPLQVGYLLSTDSHLSNSQRGGNKWDQGAKGVKSVKKINEEGGIYQKISKGLTYLAWMTMTRQVQQHNEIADLTGYALLKNTSRKLWLQEKKIVNWLHSIQSGE